MRTASDEVVLSHQILSGVFVPISAKLFRYAARQHPRLAAVSLFVMATVQTKQDLIGRLRRHRDDLRRLGVQRLGLFGSFQRDEPDPESDVDLLVEFAPEEKSFDNFMAVSFLLEEELGRSVELVTREALSPHLGPHILEDVEYVEIGD